MAKLSLLAVIVFFMLAPGGQIVGVLLILLFLFLLSADKKEQEAMDHADMMYEKYKRGEVSGAEAILENTQKGCLPMGMYISAIIFLFIIIMLAGTLAKSGHIQPIPNLPKVERPSSIK